MAFSANLLAIATTTILVLALQTFATELSWQVDFTILGSINGKTFMVPVDNTTMNAFEAKTICSNAGLELATYRDREDMMLVMATINREQEHWMGGEIPGQQCCPEARAAFRWKDETSIAEDLSFMMMSPS